MCAVTDSWWLAGNVIENKTVFGTRARVQNASGILNALHHSVDSQ